MATWLWLHHGALNSMEAAARAIGCDVEVSVKARTENVQAGSNRRTLLLRRAATRLSCALIHMHRH